MLARRKSARADIERHLAIIEWQIAGRAECMTTSIRVKARPFSACVKIARNAGMIVH